MPTLMLRKPIWLAAFLIAATCFADDGAKGPVDAPDAAIKHCDSPPDALNSLQRAHQEDASTFVLQSELDCLIQEGGGGACASAAGIDALQVLRVMAGLDKLPNPQRAVLATFTDQKELLQGRVTNEQFVKLLTFYQTYMEGLKVAVEVESAPNSPYKTDKRTWQEAKGPDLAITPRKIAILSYTVTEPNSKVLGRHFVLLKGQSKNQVDVVDPQSPVKDRCYILEHRPGDKDTHARVFLLNPAGVPRARDYVYELNTVFTVSITGEAENGSASVDHIKCKIDATAAELRGTNDFLDPRIWRKKGAAYGLPALDLPAEFGGLDWPATKMIEVFKHAGTYNLNFRDVVGGAHVRPLLKSRNREVLDVVRQVANGTGYIAIAITEPGAGSDVTAITSISRKVNGGYLLSGRKRFNARLDQATHVIVFTQSTTGVQEKLSVFLLPITTAGLKIETFPAHGLTGNSYGGLSFTDLFVPESLLIGTDGEGLDIFFEHFLYWRLMQAAAALGTGENALKQMADRIKTREAFGGPIGRFTHLQQPIGQHTTELRMAYALAREAAALIDRGDYKAARGMINGLKAEGVEIALRAVDAATRTFGGEGYSKMVDLGDRLMDLNGLRIADGTTDVMRMDVVRQKFGNEFWYMAVQPKQPNP